MPISTILSDNSRYYVALIGKETVLQSDGTMLSKEDFLQLLSADSEAIAMCEEANLLCFTTLRTSLPLPSKYRLEEIRTFFATHSEQENYIMARAKGVSTWRSRMRFCPQCGSELQDSKKETAMECTQCGAIHFPKIEPCVIVAVKNEGKILLAKHAQRNQDIYACLAGFVEDGEALEHAVRREIREEVGIEVKNIQYFGSQSWPFPFQLMIAFTAEYASGELMLQHEEIIDADWFALNALPPHPRPGSISWKLIHES